MSTMPFQENLLHFYSRKLLLHTLVNQQPPPQPQVLATTTAPSPSSLYAAAHSNFDSNVVMVLSVLLCALICSLGLNSIIRCVFRCTSLVGTEISGGQENTSSRLANTGIKKKVLKTFPIVSYWEGLQLPGLDKECVICLCEFSTGERVKILPKCNHGFHLRCIDKWLSSHSSCPTCRHSLLDMCQKIVTGGNCRSSTSSQPQEQGPTNTAIVSIAPLQHESYFRNYES